ncbi:hypothetical protein ACO1O0_007656 [Amphichorda felina]
MTAYSLYDASFGVAKDVLGSLSAVIAKAEASPVYFIAYTVHKMLSRLTGAVPKNYEDNLKTFDDMKARIAEVESQLAAVGRDAVEGRDNVIVPVGLGPNRPEAKLETWQYVHGYTVPNIFFHLTTAYDIARKEGVELGKMVYLAPFLGKFLED